MHQRSSEVCIATDTWTAFGLNGVTDVIARPGDPCPCNFMHDLPMQGIIIMKGSFQ